MQELEANAKLIAAAPKLLKALKFAVKDCPMSAQVRNDFEELKKQNHKHYKK